jgi:hypothetical protein
MTGFQAIFAQAVEKYCKERNIAFKAPLILDNAPGHPSTLSSLCENVKIVFFSVKNIFVTAHRSRDHRNI